MKKMKLNELIENEIKKDPTLEHELERYSRAIDIAIQIYALRKQRKLTQTQLARIAHVRQSNISRLESADYEGYTKKTLEKIAKALGVDLTILLIPKNKINNVNTALKIVYANQTESITFPNIPSNWQQEKNPYSEISADQSTNLNSQIEIYKKTDRNSKPLEINYAYI